MRRFRKLLVFTGILAVLGCALLLIGRIYLSSPGGANLVASRIATIYGGKVEVGQADIQSESSTLNNVRLYEAGPDASPTPWAIAQSVQAPIGFWNALRGTTTPSHLEMEGAALTFRFDAAGHLLTHFPHGSGGALPVMTIHDSKVTLKQEGRPDFVVNGVNGTLHSEGDRLIVTGTATDSRWGKWDLDASFHRKGGESTLALHTVGLHLTQAMLESLPFVAPGVWEHVKLEGDTPVQLNVRIDGPTDRVHYRVELDPKATDVTVTSIDLHATDATGKVVVEDGVVELRNVHGKTADGTIETTGDLDFRAQPNVLRFQVAVTRLDLQKLPKSWAVKAKMLLGGRLTGQADLDLTLLPGGVKTDGKGEGVIREVRIFGLHAEEVPLKLVPGASRFHILPGDPLPRPESKLGPAVLLLAGIVVPEPEPQADFLPTWIIHELTGALLTGGRAVIEASVGIMARLPRISQTPTHIEAKVVLNDVDLAQLFHNIPYQPPFPITGRASLDVQIQVPIERTKDPKAYRVAGTIRFAWLRLLDVELVQGRAQIDFANGWLRLQDISATLCSADPPGALVGSASLPLFPPGEFNAQVRFHDVALAAIASQFAAGPRLPDGSIAGAITVTIPGEKMRDPSAWQVAGTIRAAAVSVLEQTVTDFSGNIRIQHGILYLERARGIWESLPLTADGQLALTEPYRYRAAVNLQTPTEGPLQRLPLTLLGQPLLGRLAGSSEVRGTLAPLTMRTTGTVDVNELRVNQEPLGQVQLYWEGNESKVDYKLAGELLRGKLLVESSVPVGDGQFHIERAGVRRLLAVLRFSQLEQHLHGTIDLDLPFRQEGSKFLPAGKGRLAVNRLRWDDNVLAETVLADLGLTTEAIRLSNLGGSVGQAAVSGGFVYDLANPDRRRVQLIIQGVQANKLLALWPDLAKRIDGLADVRIRASLGRQWQGTLDATLQRATIEGVEVTNWRIPIEFALWPAQGRGQLDIRESEAHLAQGRAQLKTTFRWGEENQLDGRLQFFGAELRTLVRPWADNIPVAGQLSGRIDFSGRNIRSADDLTATAELSLRQSQLLGLPVFRQLAPFIAPGQALNAPFDTGEMRARMFQGIVRIEKLRLAGPIVQTVMEGTVDLQGRISLEVAANPSPFGTGLGLLRQLIHLHVSGTVRNPVVRVVPLAGVTEDLLRLLLR